MKLIVKTEDAESLLKKFKDEINYLSEIHQKVNKHIPSKTWHFSGDYFYFKGAKDLKLKTEIKSDGYLEFSFEDGNGAEEEELKSFFQVIIYFLVAENIDIESFEVIFKEKE